MKEFNYYKEICEEISKISYNNKCEIKYFDLIDDEYEGAWSIRYPRITIKKYKNNQIIIIFDNHIFDSEKKLLSFLGTRAFW